MTKILIGSAAMRYWFPDFREPKDRDYFSDEKIPGADVFWHPYLANYDWADSERGIAGPNELYTIKVSHAFWALKNRSWSKHMADIVFLQEKGYHCLRGGLYNLLYPIWEERYGKKRAYLNAEPEDFFNANVERLYDHDSLHASIAYYDRPLFEKILKEGHSVMVDKAKFDALSYEDKLRLVREEVYATALERKMIPSDFTQSARGAYAWALFKTITSFSKGWFPLFIVENYATLHKPDVDYIQRFRDNADRLIKL